MRPREIFQVGSTRPSAQSSALGGSTFRSGRGGVSAEQPISSNRPCPRTIKCGHPTIAATVRTRVTQDSWPNRNVVSHVDGPNCPLICKFGIRRGQKVSKLLESYSNQSWLHTTGEGRVGYPLKSGIQSAGGRVTPLAPRSPASSRVDRQCR